MTFTLQTKTTDAGTLLHLWTCDGCGERAPMWHRDPAKLDKSAKAHVCRVRTCALPPVVVDESDPFARC